MDRFLQSFHIGTYYLQKNARSERHIRDLRACGIDLVIGMDHDETALDLFQTYGVYAVVGGIVPGWFGAHGENAGTMQHVNKPEAYIAGAQVFADHPAIVGIDMGDEPSSLDFPYYGQVIQLNRTLFPGKLLYLNLYPSYGMLASNSLSQRARELGTDTYREYLNTYCETIDLPYLSFDHYVFSSDPRSLLRDLYDAASCCKTYGKKLFVVLQVNSHQKEVILREDQLRFQAFTALAFGASCITWACYSAGWWYHHVLDEAGEKTQQYEKLKRVNALLRPFGEALYGYHWENTLSLETDTPCDISGFSQITSSVPAVLGVFTDEDGNPALFYSPLDYEGAGSTLRFRYLGNTPLYCRNQHLSLEQEDWYTLQFTQPQPCLLTVV